MEKKINLLSQCTLLFIVNFFFPPLLFASAANGISPFWSNGLTKQERPRNQVELNSGPVLFKEDAVLINSFNKIPSPLVLDSIIDQNNSLLSHKQGKATDPVKNINVPGTSTLDQAHDLNSENVVFWKRIAATLGLHRSPKIKDLGFLQARSARDDAVVTQVGKWHDPNNPKYALNFDGGELIYFDLPPTPHASKTKNSSGKSSFYKTKPLFSNEGKVILTKSTKKMIMGNSINKAGILEANHISVMDNRIILDIKEENANSFDPINQAISSISKQAKAQSSQRLLGLVWKPRKDSKNN